MAKKVARIEGSYYIWPNGKRTHIRYIYESVAKKRNLPKGFYALAKKLNYPNLNKLVTAAKAQGLKDNVKK